MWWIVIFMATYIISIIYPFDHNCITSMVLHTFLFQNNYSIISTNRNLTEWPGRDVFSDGLPVMGCIRAGEIIPAAQKSQIEMHPAGRNNPCGTKDQDGDESTRSK